MRRFAPLVLVSVSFAVGCSGGEETAPPTTAAETATTAEETPTTAVAVTTTTAGVTTTSALDAEAAVRDVHTRFMTELFTIDERIDQQDERLAKAEELTTGAQLQRIRDRVAALPDLDVRVVGAGYISNIVEVTIEGDFATVVDCSAEDATLHSTDGSLLQTADGHYELRETQLVLEGGRWLVTEFFTGGEVPCEP